MPIDLWPSIYIVDGWGQDAGPAAVGIAGGRIDRPIMHADSLAALVNMAGRLGVASQYSSTCSLTVDELSGRSGSPVGLWVGEGLRGDVANLRVTRGR